MYFLVIIAIPVIAPFGHVFGAGISSTQEAKKLFDTLESFDSGIVTGLVELCEPDHNGEAKGAGPKEMLCIANAENATINWGTRLRWNLAEIKEFVSYLISIY
jgi:hypothetical protein